MPHSTSLNRTYSFIFPVHNEAAYLKPRLRLLQSILRKEKCTNFEILMVENGSTDKTWDILQKLRRTYNSLRILRISQASYGQAIKHGILSARGKYIFILNIDLFDTQFISHARKLLKKYSVVVGSKTLAESSDTRSWFRRLGTGWLNRILKGVWQYPGTDTHGLKAFRNTPKLIATAHACSAKHEFFDTQLLVLLSRQKEHIQEIPLRVKEIRPSRYTNWLRLKRSAIDVYRLLTFSLANAHATVKQSKKWPIIADDYGLSSLVNAAILDQVVAGHIDGVSVLANSVSATDIAPLQKFNKSHKLQLGLHFNLNRGKPVAPLVQVRSLVDTRGRFFPLPLFLWKLLLGYIDLSEVETELIAQHHQLKKFRLQINYVDSEQHVHTFGPIQEILLRFATQNQLKIRSSTSTQVYLRPRLPKYIIFCLLQRLFALTRSQNSYNVRITHPGSLYD